MKLRGQLFMKKKIITSLFVCMLTLSACGNTDSPADTSNEAAKSVIEEDTSEPDVIGEVDVDKNLLTVELTIPADYLGEPTQEDLNAIAKEKGYKSITLNDDGSATYVMSKMQHQEMMEDLANNINSSLSDMVGSEDYPNFTEIAANDNFTEFKITTTSVELGLNESLSVIAYYMYGGMYNIFNGTPVDNVHVDFINADSGEIINSANSSDMGDAGQSTE